ncbi:MAG: excisionase family DNA-binding protein [Acholeplasmataceae bacterium]|jgi:excisionase family DNA binding protein|nr:excisionase family DNA-binding protein [Methanolobus sp.]
MKNDKLLSIKELAKILSVSTRQIYRLIDNGMPFHTVGRRKRFEIDIVMGWIKCQK